MICCKTFLSVVFIKTWLKTVGMVTVLAELQELYYITCITRESVRVSWKGEGGGGRLLLTFTMGLIDHIIESIFGKFLFIS